MKLIYPVARRDEDVVDNYHGHKIQDPYRWLEDPDSLETAKYVDEQNAVARPVLENCSARSDILARLTELWNFPKYSCPYRRGDKYFFYMNTGLQNQRRERNTEADSDSSAEEENNFHKDGPVISI